jgi:hypothetical protein
VEEVGPAEVRGDGADDDCAEVGRCAEDELDERHEVAPVVDEEQIADDAHDEGFEGGAASMLVIYFFSLFLKVS